MGHCNEICAVTVLTLLLVWECACGVAESDLPHPQTAYEAAFLQSGLAYGVGDQPSLPAFPTTTSGIFFSGVFSDGLVLQRAPQQAAVYGVIVNGSTASTVTVTLSGQKPITGHVDASTMSKFGYVRWKAMLPVMPAGGNFTIKAQCTDCSGNTTTTIADVTFGDVWFCSGQSNMWLVMHFDTSRNITFDAVAAGKYSNIRMHTTPHNNQPDDALEKGNFDFFISPPPPPYTNYGGYPEGGWLKPSVGTYANITCRESPEIPGCVAYPQPDDTWFGNNIDQFSAACWHFAESLTDQMLKKGETPPPIGLIGSHWGGTMVEMWQPNATLNAQVCKNNTGGPWEPWQMNRWDIAGGGLYNGMVLPYVNMTIYGALWWQGENNVFQCHNKDGTAGRSNNGGGPNACGSVHDNSGYACKMKNLIETWRSIWSVTPGTTPSDFPFGLVSLAGGTSEGFGQNMGAFRYAQTANYGILPNKILPSTFVAQAFDAGDPCSGGGQCCTNKKDGQGGWPCDPGIAPYTGQFMGGIHPRVKRIVGERLALGAMAIAYEARGLSSKVGTGTMYTGPILQSCNVTPSGLSLTFDASTLGDDTIMVLSTVDNAIALSTNNVPITPEMLLLAYSLGPESAVEIQVNGSASNLTEGVWIPASLSHSCSPDIINKPCKISNVVNVNVPGELVHSITGVRYAWGDNPCCPSINRQVIPCPPNSCPIQTYNSTLPAVPFWATVVNNSCSWISTNGDPLPTS